MPVAALLALALVAGADPCLVEDARGRELRVCFDPGNRLELTAGGAAGGREPVRGGALDLGLALRWRGDLVARGGRLEWLRDQAFLETRALLAAGRDEPLAAHALLWRGVLVRHRTEPFLLIPGPRPIRLRFPFDVGLRLEAGELDWAAATSRELDVVPLRSALLLDLARHGAFRRIAFGPEVSWTVHLSRDRPPEHAITPFSAGVLDVRLETADGLAALSAVARAGSLLRVPGGATAFGEASLSVERVVVAVNDRPVAIYLAGAARGGPGGRSAELSAGLRLALTRRPASSAEAPAPVSR